jgi:hypothetical protein
MQTNQIANHPIVREVPPQFLPQALMLFLNRPMTVQRVSATTRESSGLRFDDKCNHLGVTP